MKSGIGLHHGCSSWVTTCVVVWIEISGVRYSFLIPDVTTCVVVWIEITEKTVESIEHTRHHLRGGVD